VTERPDSFKPAGRQFATTRWSLVLAAGDSRGPGARDALEDLCRTYWPPVYAYVRRRGYDSEEARDLTQGFFVQLLEGRKLKAVRRERGRFRTFILASVKNYLANEWDRVRAKKRGGGTVPLSLDFDGAEHRYALEPTDQATPESIFQRRWALTLLERVLEKLRQELEESGNRGRADRLLPFLTDENSRIPYNQVAADLGMSESAVKAAIHRLRKRYGALLRQEVGEIVKSPEEIDDEIRHLFAAVGSGLS
jgi:RNA polymerase sigma-70 factor (ECF subfamily)